MLERHPEPFDKLRVNSAKDLLFCFLEKRILRPSASE